MQHPVAMPSSTHQMYTMAQEQKLMAPVKQATCDTGQLEAAGELASRWALLATCTAFEVHPSSTPAARGMHIMQV